MKIKVERRKRRIARGVCQEVYDVYHHVGIFTPLFGTWLIDKSELTREEALEYIGRCALDSTCKVIINC